VTVTFKGDAIAGLRWKADPAARSSPGEPVSLELATGTIHGLLLRPEKADEPLPVALILGGSGPTDRDGNQPPAIMTDAYRLLAESLRKDGIASVRYDKRGAGASAAAGADESALRFDDYVADAAAWIDWLAKDEAYSSVIVVGHSEGSLVGMLACERSGKANGFISINGAGRPADELMLEQVGRQSAETRASLAPLFEEFRRGRTVADTPAHLAALVRPNVQPYLISWFRYDPQVEIAKLTIPVLILQGETDIQVSTDDAERLAKANPAAKIRVIPGMNHVLKQCAAMDPPGQAQSYTDPDVPISEALVRQVALFAWLDASPAEP
jgi:pimeloyl-ACP methyl ester carboxylesterase